MELTIGIVVGSILGILLSFIPGFNIGLAFIGAGLLPSPRFAIGLVIGIDLTTSVLKHLSLLNSKHREDLDDSITQSTHKSRLMTESVFGYTFAKFFIGATLAFTFLTQGSNILDLGWFVRYSSVVVGIPIWFFLIYSSKHWKIATIAFIFYGIFSFITIELPIQQPMFVLASSLFSVNLINEFRYKPEKIEADKINLNHKALKLDGIYAGIVSGLLWGLPTNAVCKLLQQPNENAYKTISRHSIADGTTSVIGLALLLANGGSRTAAASSVANFKEVFGVYEIFWILITVSILSVIIVHFWEDITKIYISIHNNTPHWVLRLSIILTVITLTIFSHGWFFVTAIIALMLRKIVKIAEAPRELSLSPIGILPLANLIKIW